MQQTKPPRGGRRRAAATAMAAFGMAKPPREGYPARRREMSRKLLVGALFALVLSLTTLGVGSKSASAEVVYNERFEAAYSPDNPCEDGANPISLSGIQHHVWYTTPDGTLKMNIQGHLTGTDADGIEYVANLQHHMEHWGAFPFPPGTPFTDTFTTNLISKGSTVNAQIIVTYDVPLGSPPVLTVTACRGS